VPGGALLPVLSAAALLATAVGASAAPRAALRVTAVPTPVVAGEPLLVQLRGVAPARDVEIRVSARNDPANPLKPCGRTFQSDRTNGSGFGRNDIPRGRFLYRGRISPISVPGRYRVCAWLQDGTRTVKRASGIVVVRAPRATVTAAVLPAVVTANAPFQVSLQTFTERRGMRAYLRIHPAGVPCAPSAAGDVLGEEIPEQVLPAGTGAVAVADDVSVPGAYTVCVWVGREPAETLAATTAGLTVLPAPE